METIFWGNTLAGLAAAGMIALMVPWIRQVMTERERLEIERSASSS